MEVLHKTPGNLRGMVQTKLRNLRNGTQTEHRFSSTDKVERISLEQHQMEYLFASDGRYTFMNTETYEQIELDVPLAYQVTERIMVENAKAPEAIEGMKAFLEHRAAKPAGS